MAAGQVSEGQPGPLVIFSGGTGTSGFAAELARRMAPVVFLVNAYDDGKSTGRIRDHLGILGPSDPAKLLTTLCSAGRVPAFQAVLAKRLPRGADAGTLSSWVETAFSAVELPPYLEEEILLCVAAFADAVEQVRGGAFEAGDLAVRNAVLVGTAYRCGGLQAGIDHLVDLLAIPADIVLASERPAQLVAELADGTYLRREADISDGRKRPAITRVSLIPMRSDTEDDPASSVCATPRAEAAVTEARGVIYGPGTLFSSIVPSVLLLGPALDRASCPKVLIANMVEEDDHITVGQSIAALVRAGGGYRQEPVMTTSFVTDVLVDYSLPTSGPMDRGQPSPIGRIADGVVLTRRGVGDDFRPGCHHEGRLLTELSALLSRSSRVAGLR